MNFKACLKQVRYWELMIIARERKVSLGANKRPKKSALVELLFSVLRDEKSLERALRGLSVDERAALDALIAVGGRMSALWFTTRFGEIRDHKPWRASSPTRPEWAPVSAAERLVHLGLIFRRKASKKSKAEDEILIPSDLLALFPQVASLSQDHDVVGRVLADSLLTDMILFLSLLNREDIRPLHGRWLPLN